MLKDAATPTAPLAHPDRSTRDDAPLDSEAEIARLRKRVGQLDHAMARLSDAVIALRRGSTALRDENRELRGQLEAARLARAGIRA
jgi:hypothetical protein